MVEKTLEQLLSEQAVLNARIAQVKSAGRDQALNTIRGLLSKYDDISANEVFGKPGKVGKEGKLRPSVAPKYRNPETGATWSGRGKPPKWIAGQDRSHFGV